MMDPATREADPHPYKMKDLCELTGLGRQAIHFYIQRGLLPPGRKTGRNMAWYGEEHLERLKLIKRLQHERFLPLKAIKAILDGQQGVFSASQRGFLLGVKQHLGPSIAEGADRPGETVRVDATLERIGLDRADFDRMLALELIGVREDDDGNAVLAADDLWILESWAEVQRLGFDEALGFTVDDLVLYEEMVTQLFQAEAQMLLPRLKGVDPARAAEMIERGLPIVNAFLTGLHRAKIRNFLASIG
ncbi:MAG TPA: hypothetical protein DEF51_44050 [Myxococcales bacterium]|nr:hypothetical protein [Myxococcales bacterium]